VRGYSVAISDGSAATCVKSLRGEFDQNYDRSLARNTFSSTAHDSGGVVSVESVESPEDRRLFPGFLTCPCSLSCISIPLEKQSSS